MKLPLCVAAAAMAFALVSCSLLPTDNVCAGVGYWPVDVRIADAVGQPEALGAVVTLTDGTYQERDTANYDPFNILAAAERGGRTYDIHVSKPYYIDVIVVGVHAPGGGCVTNQTAAQITVPVILTAAVNAPPVRSVRLLPQHVLLDRNRVTSYSFTSYVDANLGVSHAVSWSIAGDTASVGFDPVSGTLTYRCLATSGYVTLTARSVVNPALFDTANVAVQGHPAASNDPPCT